LVSTIDFKTIVEELRTRLVSSGSDHKIGDKIIRDKIRCRLADLRDTDLDAPIDVVAKLDENWRQDGLIQENSD
jgi:hypothetical protein